MTRSLHGGADFMPAARSSACSAPRHISSAQRHTRRWCRWLRRISKTCCWCTRWSRHRPPLSRPEFLGTMAGCWLSWAAGSPYNRRAPAMAFRHDAGSLRADLRRAVWAFPRAGDGADILRRARRPGPVGQCGPALSARAGRRPRPLGGGRGARPSPTTRPCGVLGSSPPSARFAAADQGEPAAAGCWRTAHELSGRKGPFVAICGTPRG